MARFVGSVGTSRDLYWGLKSTGDGLESGTNSGPCGTASGMALEAGFMCMLWEHSRRAGAMPAE